MFFPMKLDKMIVLVIVSVAFTWTGNATEFPFTCLFSPDTDTRALGIYLIPVVN